MSRPCTRRPALPLAATATLALLATGCQVSLTSVTLPGGAASRDVFLSQKTRTYDVVFADALDLVPQSSVHVNDVNVGDVESVKLLDGKALVRVRVLDNVAVPANAVGALRQTSLLGEKYVSLEMRPGVAPEGRLADHALIPASDTTEEAQVEDVFGALSALLNGGGIEQLQTISVELSKALTGRESQLRSLLSELTTFTTKLDQRRTEITHALDSLDRLAITLKAQRQTITTALDKIAPGLTVLDNSRKDLEALLAGLDRLGAVAVRVENRTQADTVADLRALQPTLDRLQQSGDNIVNSLQLLVTFPFGDNALKAIFSDYTGLKATVNLDLRPGSPANLLGPNGACGALPSSLPGAVPSGCGTLGGVVNGVTGGLVPTTGAGLPGLPGLPGGGVGGVVGGLSGGLTGQSGAASTAPSASPAPSAGSQPAPADSGSPGAAQTTQSPGSGLATLLGGGR